MKSYEVCKKCTNYLLQNVDVLNSIKTAHCSYQDCQLAPLPFHSSPDALWELVHRRIIYQQWLQNVIVMHNLLRSFPKQLAQRTRTLVRIISNPPKVNDDKV